MRPICLALAATAVGIAGLLSTAGAEEVTSTALPANPAASAQPSADQSAAKVTDITPQLHYVTSDSTVPVAGAKLGADVPPVGATPGSTQPLPPEMQAGSQRAGALKYQQDPNWSAQLQYSYMAVGNNSDAVNACCDAHDSWRIDRQILAMQLGVSYHFK
jgi:hypothetical protein